MGTDDVCTAKGAQRITDLGTCYITRVKLKDEGFPSEWIFYTDFHCGLQS